METWQLWTTAWLIPPMYSRTTMSTWYRVYLDFLTCINPCYTYGQLHASANTVLLSQNVGISRVYRDFLTLVNYLYSPIECRHANLHRTYCYSRSTKWRFYQQPIWLLSRLMILSGILTYLLMVISPVLVCLLLYGWKLCSTTSSPFTKWPALLRRSQTSLASMRSHWVLGLLQNWRECQFS